MSNFPGEHMCQECFRYVHEHRAEDCEPEMGGPWECQSYPMHCCKRCPCDSFKDAHPDEYNPILENSGWGSYDDGGLR